MKRVLALVATTALTGLLLLFINSTLQAAAAAPIQHASPLSGGDSTDPDVVFRLKLLAAAHTGSSTGDAKPSSMDIGPADVVCLAAQASNGGCRRVILVLMVAPPISPSTTSTRTGAPISVTTRFTTTENVIFNGSVPASGRVVVGVVSSTFPFTAHVGSPMSPTLPPFSNTFSVPCECTDGAGLLQVREIALSESGPTIPDRSCGPGNETCKRIILVLTLPPPPPPGPPTTTSPYAGASVAVFTPTQIFSGSVPSSGRVVVGVVGTNRLYTVSVGFTVSATAFTQVFMLPCTCDDGAGLLQVAEAQISPAGVEIIMPGCPAQLSVNKGSMDDITFQHLLSGAVHITYTIGATNIGLGPVTNVVITDAIPLSTTYVSGSAVPPPTSGPDPLEWVVPTLAVGERFTATFVVQATQSAAGSIVTNTAYARYDGSTNMQASALSSTVSNSLPPILRVFLSLIMRSP